MNKLAIDGGTPAFQPDELTKLIPAWPPNYPETDRKLLEVYHSGKWGLCGKYEQLLMEEFAAFQDTKYSIWMCNGTTTLECALLALGAGFGAWRMLRKKKDSALSSDFVGSENASQAPNSWLGSGDGQVLGQRLPYDRRDAAPRRRAPD